MSDDDDVDLFCVSLDLARFALAFSFFCSVLKGTNKVKTDRVSYQIEFEGFI